MTRPAARDQLAKSITPTTLIESVFLRRKATRNATVPSCAQLKNPDVTIRERASNLVVVRQYLSKEMADKIVCSSSGLAIDFGKAGIQFTFEDQFGRSHSVEWKANLI